MKKLCVVCHKPIIHYKKGIAETHPGECREKYYQQKGYGSLYCVRVPRSKDCTKRDYKLKTEPTDKEREAMGIRKPQAGKIKCLGPLQPEHKFTSQDVIKNRICPTCAAYNNRTAA